jgi:RNA ligase (TIGR02306 family)
MNNLATIQKVKNVRPCPNSENLDLVQILGWQVVTKRGEFPEDSLCIYVSIDTVLPETATFEFLRNKSFRIKPIRLRGEESAGICFPLSILPANYSKDPMTLEVGESISPFSGYKEGEDVTDILGIKKYEKPIPAELQGKMVGHIPSFLIITDEDNLRTYPDAIPELWSRPYYITRKDDGCSGTFFMKDLKFGVCSRRIHLEDTEGNGYWKMAKKYDLERILKAEWGDYDIAVQGEVCGPAIQDNHIGLTEMELHIFNLFDIKNRRYLSYETLTAFCAKYNLPMVVTLNEGASFGFTLEELVKFASEQKYPNGQPAEGIVIRPKEGFTSTVLKKSWSGKVLNPLFEEEKKKKK